MKIRQLYTMDEETMGKMDALLEQEEFKKLNRSSLLRKLIKEKYEETKGAVKMKQYTVQEVFEAIKNAEEEVSFAVVDETGAVLVNTFTKNWQSAFSHPATEEREAFYGVYGDAVREWDQLDSRKDRDESIIRGLEDLATHGVFVKASVNGTPTYRSSNYFYVNGTRGTFPKM